jgi:hypothetical protein
LFALDLVASGSAFVFQRTVRQCGAGWRLLQESEPVCFKGFPASDDPQSNQKEDNDEACLSAANFTAIKIC